MFKASIKPTLFEDCHLRSGNESQKLPPRCRYWGEPFPVQRIKPAIDLRPFRYLTLVVLALVAHITHFDTVNKNKIGEFFLHF